MSGRERWRAGLYSENPTERRKSKKEPLSEVREPNKSCKSQKLLKLNLEWIIYLLRLTQSQLYSGF